MSLIIGPLFLVIGVGLLYLSITAQKITSIKMQIIGAGFVAISLCDLFIVYPTVIRDLIFRFDVTKVSELKIEPLNEKDKCPPLIINDKQVILDGLEELRSAEALWLSHTSFSNEVGYRIQITSSDFRYYQYLTVYYKTGQGKEAQAVVPQLYVSDITHQQGYKSPEFHRWVNDNVAPFFEDCLN